jgi:hypothetical protein
MNLEQYFRMLREMAEREKQKQNPTQKPPRPDTNDNKK